MVSSQQRLIYRCLLPGLLGIALVACAGEPVVSTEPTPPAQRTVVPSPTPDAEPTPESRFGMTLGVSGIGEVQAKQESSLSFAVSGTVDQVYVAEGDTVKADDLLAILDVRPFEQRIRQAEAALADALARQAALTEPPRAAEVAAARAQITEAEAALAQLLAGAKEQDVQNARAALEQANAQLQAQRESLSTAKVDAELRVQQAANTVRDRQDEYSRIYWENRELENELRLEELPQENKDREEAALRAVETAEQNLEQARLAYEQAQQAEITGIRQAEQQVIQAEAQLEKLLLPPDPDDVAAAEARIAQARASLDRLLPNPTDSEIERAAAAVAQAQSQLEAAQLDREYAELRAPFDGTVAIVNIDPGDPSAVGGQPAIELVDNSELYVEVDITDVDISKIALGQAATIFVEALPEEVFTGRVSYIAPTATVSGNVRTYEVQIALDDQTGLRDGMSVRVELETDAEEA